MEARIKILDGSRQTCEGRKKSKMDQEGRLILQPTILSIYGFNDSGHGCFIQSHQILFIAKSHNNGTHYGAITTAVHIGQVK